MRRRDVTQLCNKMLPPTWTPSVFHDQQHMHTKLSLMYLAKFITVYQLIQKHFCQQYKLQSYDIWVTPFQQFFIYCNFFFFLADGASPAGPRFPHWKGATSRGATWEKPVTVS